MMLATLVHALRVISLTVYASDLLPPRDDGELADRAELAAAIAVVTEDAQERRQLMRIARFESNYRSDVIFCDKLGPENEVTAFQILVRRGEDAAWMCSDLVAGAVVALERLRESVAACRHLPAPDRLALYARGSCSSKQGVRLSRVRYAP